MTPKTFNNIIRTAFTFLVDEHSLTEQYSEKRVEFAFSAMPGQADERVGFAQFCFKGCQFPVHLFSYR